MTKKPFVAKQHSAANCPNCGQDAVAIGTTTYRAEIKHDGRLRVFDIPDLRAPICRSCCKITFTEDVDKQINDALRAHLNVLTPEQIRQGIERLNISQKEVVSRIGIAEATLSRWLNGSQIQSQALDTLLRLFFGSDQVRSLLGDGSKDPSLGTCDEQSGLRLSSHIMQENDRRAGQDFWQGRSTERRDSCRSAQAIVQQAGSTWGKRCA
jgi:transcriptional regulator with XRE-family HTH domain